LQFIDVVLGDQPALEPDERFYQRLLAGDATDATDQAEKRLKDQPPIDFYDAVPMRALMLAQADVARGKLSRDQQDAVRETLGEILDDLAQEDDPETGPAERPALYIVGRSPLDEGAALLLAKSLGTCGVSASVQPLAEFLATVGAGGETPALLCLSYFGDLANPSPVRYLIRRLRRKLPHVKVLAGYWSSVDDRKAIEECRVSTGADFLATSLAEAVRLCLDEAKQPGLAAAAEAPHISAGQPVETDVRVTDPLAALQPVVQR